MPVILGSNGDEFRTFVADKPEHSRLLPGRIPWLRHRSAYLAETACQSRMWKAVNVEAMADAMLRGGHAEVWTYRFDWDEAPAIPFLRPDLSLGAAHGMEMAFVFRDIQGELDLFKIFTPFNRTGRRQVASAMADAWVSFAREGQPSAGWTRRSLVSQAPDSLVFDSESGGSTAMKPVRESVDDIKRALFNDASLSPRLRCQIYARVFVWNPLFAEHAAISEYERWRQELRVQDAVEAFRPMIPI